MTNREAAPRFPILSVQIPESRREELGVRLFELGAGGIEELDQTTRRPGPGPEQVALIATFSSLEQAGAARDQLALEEPELTCRLEELVGDEWREAYKEHFKPFSLTPSITVAPPWVEYRPTRPDELVLWLDPSRAYGTGLHTTTQLVAEHMERLAEQISGRHLLDVGTGSGILALAGLLLGADRAVAIDNDPEVMDVARGNAELNGMTRLVTVSTTPMAQLEEEFPVVVANLDRRTLEATHEELGRCVAPGGTLVVGGVLVEEGDRVLSLFTGGGFRLGDTSQRGDEEDGWLSFVLSRS